MFKLIQNELIKIFARKKIYIFMGIIFIMTLITTLVYRYSGMEIQMSAQKLPLETLKMNLEMLLPIFISILIADIITDEYRSGTLKLPLIHPISRSRLLNAKVLVLTVSLIILIIFSMVVSYGLGLIFFEWGTGLTFNEIEFTTIKGILFTVGSHFISVIPLLAFSMMIMLLSLKLSSSGAVVGAAIGVIFGFNILLQLSEAIRPFLLNYYFNYYVMVFQDVYSKETLLGLMVIALYGLGAYFVSLNVFKRKDIVF